jgi:hypothetical protein
MEEPMEVEQESMVVLYDPSTGNIAHVEHAITYRGGQHPDKEALESAAQTHASQAAGRHGLPLVQGLAVLHVSPESFNSDVKQRVDTEEGVLVEVTR